MCDSVEEDIILKRSPTENWDRVVRQKQKHAICGQNSCKRKPSISPGRTVSRKVKRSANWVHLHHLSACWRELRRVVQGKEMKRMKKIRKQNGGVY